jgi:hypothetical protein
VSRAETVLLENLFSKIPYTFLDTSANVKPHIKPYQFLKTDTVCNVLKQLFNILKILRIRHKNTERSQTATHIAIQQNWL